MIDIKELRRLAQAAIAKMNASDPEFASSTPPLAILELLDRLEAAEKERDALRAKVAEMEKQEPVMWANSSNINSSRINRERGGCGDQHTCSETQTTYHDTQLYALPGAKGEEK